MRVRLLASMLLGIAVSCALPLMAPAEEPAVPEALQPWKAWVLAGHERELCPFLLGDADNRRCAWPASIDLRLDDRGATFAQQWEVFARTYAPLPGDAKHWPQEVRVDGAAAVVLGSSGVPQVLLHAGAHKVTGNFRWDAPPELLQIPAETGLLALTVRGQTIDFPNRDEQGRLWLQKAQPTGEILESRLDVIVHRLVSDDVPLVLTTRFELKVSGRGREVLLGKVLPDGFVPMSLVGPLPARVEPDGHVRVQVRPGEWHFELTARRSVPDSALTLPQPDQPWDPDEAWVFAARNDLRIVTVEGVAGIDAQQTQLPDEWRSYPAYLMRPGDTMKLVEQRRGDADPAPDRLTLARTLWLDFDGAGFTVQDRLSGTMSRSWRLDMGPQTHLGRAAISGTDQFLTSRLKGGPSGFEVRSGQVDVQADSRVEGGSSSIPAVGWNHDFEQVSATLHLPPGWRILHATGVDAATPTWVTAWTLLDLFLVLMIAFAVWKLWSRNWGLVALATLFLGWHENVMPHWIWLVVLAAEALTRALPEGAIRHWMRILRALAWVVLVLIVIPFLLLQARSALYPQLETPWGESWNLFGAQQLGADLESAPMAEPPLIEMQTPANAPATPQPEEATPERKKAEAEKPAARGASSEYFKYKASSSNVLAPDPRSLVSTGPGLPSWQWSTISLTWRGPVEASQRVRLFLVPPALRTFSCFARIFLVSILALLMLGLPVGTWLNRIRRRTPEGAAAAAIVIALMLAPRPAAAEIPTPDLLQELQKRLLAKPDCSPNCADLTRLALNATPSRLTARLEVVAAALTAVPLPGGAQQWTPATVTLDGAVAGGLLRSSDGALWLPVTPGSHQVVMDGPLPDRETVQIPLPLKPHRVEATLAGWTLDGVHEDGLADDNLQLSRIHGAVSSGGTVEATALSPFVRVDRHVSIGLSWLVETRVARLTPLGQAIVLEVPLLAGESITTADVRSENGKVTISIGPQASEVAWTSVLPEASEISLKAPESVPWVEVWDLDVSPIWHVETQGIPTIHQADESSGRIREWHPWPGESIQIVITRPAGAGGQTLTIDKSGLHIEPGQRSTTVSLVFSFRSSRGGQHTITIEERSELQSVQIDGAVQPVRLENRKVRIPTSPGSHLVQVTWRQPGGCGLGYRTPEVGLGVSSVNSSVNVSMPADRWTLVLGGPRLGPAVLFWSILVIVLLLSIGLGRLNLTPLRWWHWLLLSLGLTQTPIPIAALIVVWLLAIGWRREHRSEKPLWFNSLQIVLVLLTGVALICLLWSVAQGLLGLPDMQIAGNGSSAQSLQWYQDRAGETLPQAWIVSVPLLVYRLAMLTWALWLAISLIGWLKWAWTCFTHERIWSHRPKPPQAPLAPPPLPR